MSERKAEKHIPRAIGIIIDGNRRWARERGLSTFEGHTIGYEKIRDLLSWSQEAGIKELTVYAFSSENWNRTSEEVGYLIGLIERNLTEWTTEALEKNIRMRVIGDRNKFSKRIQERITELEEKTKAGTKGILVFALSYGGREEIIAAANAFVRVGKEIASADEFKKALWSEGLADPDLIIRTGGEQRLSNFLPWQSIYSELFFTRTYWPDFSKEEFDEILDSFATRQRRFGT